MAKVFAGFICFVIFFYEIRNLFCFSALYWQIPAFKAKLLVSLYHNVLKSQNIMLEIYNYVWNEYLRSFLNKLSIL